MSNRNLHYFCYRIYFVRVPLTDCNTDQQLYKVTWIKNYITTTSAKFYWNLKNSDILSLEEFWCKFWMEKISKSFATQNYSTSTTWFIVFKLSDYLGSE